jgi:hypothetical protein
MECDRFKKLVKSWYLQVQDEALAPARMVTLMKQHVADCRVCLLDPSVRQEVEKITEIVLPPSKIRQSSSKPEAEASIEEEVLVADESEPEEGEESEEREEEGGEEEEDFEEEEEEEEEDNF